MKGWTCLGAAMVIGGLLLPQPASSASRQGWALLQQSPQMGALFVYFNSEGMAVVNKDVGFTLVTRAPQWNVVMYNDKTRVYYSCSLEDWKYQFLNSTKGGKSSPRPVQSSFAPPRKIDDGTIAGLPCAHYSYIGAPPIVTSNAKRMEVWVSTGLQVPDQISRVLRPLLTGEGQAAAAIRGVPLKAGYYEDNNKFKPMLDTKTARTEPIPLASFNYPSSYQRVNSQLEVLVDEKGRKTMNSLAEDLGSDSSDIDELLGGSSSTKSAPAAGRTVSTYRPARPVAPALRPQATPAKGQSGDWFSGFADAMGKKK